MKFLLSVLLFASSCAAHARGGSFGGGGSFGRSSSSYSRSSSTSTFKSGSTFGGGKSTTGAIKSLESTPMSRPWSMPSPTAKSYPVVIHNYTNSSGMPWYYYYWLFHNPTPVAQPMPVTNSVLPLTVKCCRKEDVKCEPNLKPCVQDDKWQFPSK